MPDKRSDAFHSNEALCSTQLVVGVWGLSFGYVMRPSPLRPHSKGGAKLALMTPTALYGTCWSMVFWVQVRTVISTLGPDDRLSIVAYVRRKDGWHTRTDERTNAATDGQTKGPSDERTRDGWTDR